MTEGRSSMVLKDSEGPDVSGLLAIYRGIRRLEQELGETENHEKRAQLEALQKELADGVKKSNLSPADREALLAEHGDSLRYSAIFGEKSRPDQRPSREFEN